MTRIQTAAVLGAGNMGAQIAAHLANAGVPTWLLDVTPDAARAGLERARAMRPDPFFTSDTHTLIRTGGFEDLSVLGACDWVIEAIVEQLDIKQGLLERVEAHVGGETIVTSNTSGIPLASIADGRSESFRSRWLGTHFFNPPRYLPLLEVIPTAHTRADVVETIVRFADQRLGKGVVVAKDTPGFIANRIGLYRRDAGVPRDGQRRLTIEDVDAITGPAIGRPKSATFRTDGSRGPRHPGARDAGPVGAARPGAEAEAFAVPALVDGAGRRGWTGAKAGGGFYRRTRQARSMRWISRRWSYRPAARPALAGDRSGPKHRGHGRADPHACSSARIGSASSCARRWRRRCSMRRGSRATVASRRGRHRSRDAVGVRLGARPVRDAAGDRRRERRARPSARQPPRRRLRETAHAPCAADDPAPPTAHLGRVAVEVARPIAPRSSVAIPARAWSISATASSASSSTRR